MQADIYLIILLVGVLILCLVGLLVLKYAKRKYPSDIDLMEGHDFEYFCADLLRKKGFQEVEVTKGSSNMVLLDIYLLENGKKIDMEEAGGNLDNTSIMPFVHDSLVKTRSIRSGDHKVVIKVPPKSSIESVSEIHATPLTRKEKKNKRKKSS